MGEMLKYDFGYTWPWVYGHLWAAAAFFLLAAATWWLGWPRLVRVACLGGALWALAGFVIVHGVFRFNRPLVLPTERFLNAGSGRVLDGGAGSGRSTLMVLLGRPRATVVALDIFDNRFGIGDNTPERLLKNAAIAGVADRVEARAGDMRQMPFESGSFDAAVSAYTIDHLRSKGVEQSLAEMARVLRPNGQLLLMVVNPDRWIFAAFPFMAAHGYFGHGPGTAHWRTALETAGFDVVEQGTQPGSLYFLAARK
jgi:SAM-dependent methyltransferase